MSWRTRRAAKDNEDATHITFKMKHVPASHLASRTDTPADTDADVPHQRRDTRSHIRTSTLRGGRIFWHAALSGILVDLCGNKQMQPALEERWQQKAPTERASRN